MKRSLVLEEPPLIVLPGLAVAIGLEGAIVYQKLKWLLRENGTCGRVLSDGHRWVYNTLDEWHAVFPFWSTRTIQRVFSHLKKNGWIVTCQPEGAISRRTYYRLADGQAEHLSYERLEEAEQRVSSVEHAKLASSGTRQTGMFEHAKLAPSSYREYTTENTYIHCEVEPRDACEEAFASLEAEDLSQITDWGRYKKATCVVRAACPGVTPDEIAQRAANYATWYSVPITAMALAKHWSRCAKPRPAPVIQKPKPPKPQRPRRDGATTKEQFAEWAIWKTYIKQCRDAGYEPDPMT